MMPDYLASKNLSQWPTLAKLIAPVAYPVPVALSKTARGQVTGEDDFDHLNRNQPLVTSATGRTAAGLAELLVPSVFLPRHRVGEHSFGVNPEAIFALSIALNVA